MRSYICMIVFGGLTVSSFVQAVGAPTEEAAAKLIEATVTVRAVTETAGETKEVLVCSGVSLGKGRIVTFHTMPPSDAALPRYRVTLKGGDQADASLRVIDRHSGLILMEVDNREIPGLALAREATKIGGTVLTAAAAGIEDPAVSAGILGAIDRTPTGIDLPPLLQCDVRSSETASGAAVVNERGELLGIVAAADPPGARGGWTYALPVRHVERILAAKVDGKLIEIKRRRPVVGFTIGAGAAEGSVLVERVDQKGPAAAAGIRPGDLIAEADGRKIRSAYQAIDLILKKQPGDQMGFTVTREGKPINVKVLLDGGAMPVAEIPQASASPVKVGPQLKARRGDSGEITIRDDNTLSEVAVDPNRGQTRRSIGNEAELLRLQLEAYERVFGRMQTEIESLRRETSDLQERLKERNE
jgi:S1-C subfamily serine protease